MPEIRRESAGLSVQRVGDGINIHVKSVLMDDG